MSRIFLWVFAAGKQWMFRTLRIPQKNGTFECGAYSVDPLVVLAGQ